MGCSNFLMQLGRLTFLLYVFAPLFYLVATCTNHFQSLGKTDVVHHQWHCSGTTLLQVGRASLLQLPMQHLIEAAMSTLDDSSIYNRVKQYEPRFRF